MQISEHTRRNIIDYLLLRDYPFYGRLDLISFLRRIWDLASLPSTDSRFKNAEGDIHQHMINNADWENDYLLLTYFDLTSCNDNTFISFLETCVHPIVLNDPAKISETVEAFNAQLKSAGLILTEIQQVSGPPLFKVKSMAAQPARDKEERYEIVLSFAGEDRVYVEAVAKFLKEAGILVFYDKYEESTLWGKDLAEHLDKVYRGSARYCVMFISSAYKDNVWPTHERRSALAKALLERTEYILPARFDNTEIPGIRSTLGYVDLTKKSPEQLGVLIAEKLGKLESVDKIKILKGFRFLLDERNAGTTQYRALIKHYFETLDLAIPILVQSETFEDFIEKVTGTKLLVREFAEGEFRPWSSRKGHYVGHCQCDPIPGDGSGNWDCIEYAVGRDLHLELNVRGLHSFQTIHASLSSAINE